MPGLDLSQVSSNWKKLQAQLQAEKKTHTTTSSTTSKRKRDTAPNKSTSTVKKPRLDPSQNVRTKVPSKRLKMGMSESKITESAPATTADRSRLLKEHGIAPEDIAAAYGSNTDSKSHRGQHFEDDVNGGFHPSHKVGQYVALDCEMVGTGPPPHHDNVLARASLVNYHGEQIYDSYVQAPPNIEVKDYRTFVSGIRPEHMRAGYARTEAQVRTDVAKLLQGKVLVGHALKNDLEVLQLSHPRPDMRDTSRHPKFRLASRGRPPALRKLAKAELGVDIQTGEHSSVEDARAAMMLFKKDKSGFEEEHRKHFGQNSRSRRAAADRLGKSVEVTTNRRNIRQEDGDDDLNEPDLDVDDEDVDGFGEEDEDDDHDLEANGVQGSAMAGTKKKRKKKKRTKRK